METKQTQAQAKQAQTQTGCAGTAKIHKHGSHPVMQKSNQETVQVNAADHVHHGAESIITTSTDEIQEGVFVTTQEVDGEGNVVKQTQTLVSAAGSSCLDDKVHWGAVGFIGGVLGAAANFDRGLTAMVTGAVAAGVTAAAVSHYRDNYSLVSGLVAAAGVGAGVRYLSPYLLGKADEDNTEASVGVIMNSAPEASAFA